MGFVVANAFKSTTVCIARCFSLEPSGGLNDQFLEKGLFLFQIAKWHLKSFIWLIINYRGNNVAAPQSQQLWGQRICFTQYADT